MRKLNPHNNLFQATNEILWKHPSPVTTDMYHVKKNIYWARGITNGQDTRTHTLMIPCSRKKASNKVFKPLLLPSNKGKLLNNFFGTDFSYGP